MELRQIKHFLEIVRCASFGQAAEKMHITQPALSKSIRNLEQSLGVMLLERHPGGVVPTQFGKVFMEYAMLITSEIDRAIEELNELKGSGRGIVRVGAGATMMQYLLPQAVRAFVQSDESASVVFRQGLRDELLASLRRGEIDIVVGSTDGLRGDEDFRQENVLLDEIVVVANGNHPLANRDRVEIAELGRYRWVLPDGTEGERNRLTRVMRDAGLPPPSCVIRTPSSTFMATMLQEGEYLSYLPRALIRLDHEYAHLQPLPLDQPIWDKVMVGVTYRRRGVMLAPVRRFINRLIEVGASLDKKDMA
ncbi:LysR family transcriptional regulator [Sphingobium algorifonticola]|uniref:LysR family transcriptional regulator n=1 Tax=Sphingobium algorifonticola TaxID=2008318 RepID=A0A437J9U0_9SPHN|nr:LysR family transcriptional regulator [Sphingobium algorifonticola]RVT42268.1 LysR family transcriptional regulator [Sphingobium algorifonticola]